MIKVVRFYDDDELNILESDSPTSIPNCGGSLESLSLPAQSFEGIISEPIVISTANINLIIGGRDYIFLRDVTKVEVYISYDEEVSRLEDMVMIFSGVVSSGKLSDYKLNIKADTIYKINRNKNYQKILERLSPEADHEKLSNIGLGQVLDYFSPPILMGAVRNVPAIFRDIFTSKNGRQEQLYFIVGDENFIRLSDDDETIRKYFDDRLDYRERDNPEEFDYAIPLIYRNELVLRKDFNRGSDFRDTYESINEDYPLDFLEFGTDKTTKIEGTSRPVIGVPEQIELLLRHGFGVPKENIESMSTDDLFRVPPLFGIYEKDGNIYEVLKKLLNTCGCVLISVPGERAKLKIKPIPSKISIEKRDGSIAFNVKGTIEIKDILEPGITVNWSDKTTNINSMEIGFYLDSKPYKDKSPVFLDASDVKYVYDKDEDRSYNNSFGRLLKIETAEVISYIKDDYDNIKYYSPPTIPVIFNRFKSMIQNHNSSSPIVEFSTAQRLTDFELLDIVNFNPIINGRRLSPEGRYIIMKIDYAQGKLSLRYWAEKIE